MSIFIVKLNIKRRSFDSGTVRYKGWVREGKKHVHYARRTGNRVPHTNLPERHCPVVNLLLALDGVIGLLNDDACILRIGI